jgi:hypothetical protein
MAGFLVLAACGDARPPAGGDATCPPSPLRIAEIEDVRAEAILGGMGLARASADATHRYWIQRPPWEENVLVRAPNDAPAAIEEVTRLPATGDAVGVTVDPTGPFVYWTDDEGRVGRVEKRGGGGELLSETGPYDDDDYRPFVAVRGDSVLWIGGEPGRRADDDHPAGLYELCK